MLPVLLHTQTNAVLGRARVYTQREETGTLVIHIYILKIYNLHCFTSNALYASMMRALYNASRKLESVEILTILSIQWCACEINSYEIMFLAAPYSMTKLFEFREGYITRTMVSVDMCEMLYILWEQFEFSRTVCRGSRK